LDWSGFGLSMRHLCAVPHTMLLSAAWREFRDVFSSKYWTNVLRRHWGLSASGCPHGGLLQSFDLQSLSVRRSLNAADFWTYLVRGRVDCPDLLVKLSLGILRPNLRSISTFVVPTPRTNVLRRFPLFHAISNYSQIEHQVGIFVCRASDVGKAYGVIKVS
jgi:hypothetical protein